MTPTHITKTIVAALSLLGELAAVMRSNNVPLKREGKLSASKGGVTQGATSWECTRNVQARMMLEHYGKPVNVSTVAEMEDRIAKADLSAKAGYAIQNAFGVKIDDLHSQFLALEKAGKGASESKGAEKPAKDASKADKDAKAKAKAEMKQAIADTEAQLKAAA